MSSPAEPPHRRRRPADLLPGVDRSAFATSLGRRLQDAGLDVDLTAVETFARGLEVTPPDRRSRLYWLARVTLVRRPADLPAFDAVFDVVFGAATIPLDPAARRTGGWPRPAAAGEGASSDHHAAVMPAGSGGDLPWLHRPVALRAVEPPEPAAPDPPAVPERRPSRLEAIADLPFADLDAADLALVQDCLAEALVGWPTRASRRQRSHPAGRRVSLRRTLVQARRTAFEPVQLRRERPVVRPRRLVLVCDVSQSMEPYAAAYLQLMRVATMVNRSEVFAFATSLTRLTVVLRHTSPELAVELAGRRVADRFGGTRIAANLRHLLGSHHGDSVRGAVVVIASDGWDSDDPAELAVVMRRLRRRVHQVVWVNPRKTAPGYAPLVGAMVAALPHVDAMLPAGTVRELAEVIRTVTTAGSVSSTA